MLYQRKTRRDATFDLSPLIDVVFLLLIFFMVSTTFKDHIGLDLELPQAESERVEQTKELIVAVDRQKAVYLSGEKTDVGRLKQQIEAELSQRTSKMVVLEVDASVEHGMVVEVMDAARAAGATGITFSAKRKEQP